MVGGRGTEGNTPGSAASGRASAAFLIALVAAGALWRGLVSLLTPLPSEDGVNYLWMAEQLAAGRAGLALDEAFPPLTSLAIAPLVAMGLDPFRAGQVALALAGALAVVFVVRATEAIFPDGGRTAGWFAVFAPLPVRLGAEIYSEPLFVMLTALGIQAGLRGAGAAAGLAAGLAFWVRPEAACLLGGLLLADPRAMWRAVPPFAAAAGALALWRGACGHGFNPLGDLLGFVVERSVAGTDEPGAGAAQLFDNAIHLPWLWVEAFGAVGLLAAWGAIRGPRRGQAALYWTLFLGAVVICGFLARRRFLVAWFAAVVPIAVAGFRSLPPRLRAPVLWAVVLTSAAASLRTTSSDRWAERAVGEQLAGRLGAGERIVGDMTRVIYYAGRRPLPPRPFAAGELIELAAEPAVRFVVLGARRPAAPRVEAALQKTFGRATLPAGVAAGAAERGILVLERR